MSPRRVAAVSRKVLRTLRRDRRTLALALVAPIVAMIVFGFVFGTEVANVPVAVVNEDRGPLGAQVLARIDAATVAQTAYPDWESASRAVRDGDVRAALRIPENFSRDARPTPGTLLVPPRPANGTSIDVALDGSNSQMSAAVTRAVGAAVAATLEAEMAANGARIPIRVEPAFVHAAEARFMDFFVPGIMTFAVLMFTTLLAILAFVGERTTGTLARLLVTPVRTSEIVLGYAGAFSLLAIAQGALLLGVALLLFDVLVVGSLALVAVIVSAMALNALFLGILLSAAARREAQAIQFFPLITFPTFLLSGIFVPVESLPAGLQPLAWLIPPTWATEALRLVMLKGADLPAVAPHLAALVGFAAAFLGLAVLGLRGARAVR